MKNASGMNLRTFGFNAISLSIPGFLKEKGRVKGVEEDRDENVYDL